MAVNRLPRHDIDSDEVVRLYVEECKSTTEIADHLSIPVSTIRSRLKGRGVLRSRGDGVRLASPRLSASRTGIRRQFSEGHKKNISEARKKSPRIGVSLKPNGYFEYTTGPCKGRSVHVVAMEAHIERHLAPDEVVHHRDGNRTNNELDNLELMTRSEHARHHASKRRKD